MSKNLGIVQAVTKSVRFMNVVGSSCDEHWTLSLPGNITSKNSPFRSCFENRVPTITNDEMVMDLAVEYGNLLK